MSWISWCICALLTLLVAGHAAANTIVVSGTLFTIDADSDGADDSTINRVTFDVTAGATVTFDILAFEVDTDTNVESDLNGDMEITVLDTWLLLFDDATQLPVSPPPNSNDDGPLGGDGSINTNDSNFFYTFADGGTYFVTIGDAGTYSPQEALSYAKIDDPGSWAPPLCPDGWVTGGTCETDHGDWQLTLSVPDAGEGAGTISNVLVTVPEPTTILMVSMGLVGLVAAGRRPD